MNQTRSRAHWTDLSPSDVMNSAFPQLWNTSYNQLITATPSDWWSLLYGAPPSTGQTTAQSSGQIHRTHGRHTHDQRRQHYHSHDCGCHQEERGCGCGCEKCSHDPCQCQCCICDADFVVYTRVGEQRVIPLVIDNERRREKEITLELSGWTTRGGKPAPVLTEYLEPTAFTLAPCEEKKVTLVVKVVGLIGQDGEGRETLGDVEDCLVAYADLRVTGCDHRCIRIALAILPRDCDPYEVGCGCDCC